MKGNSLPIVSICIPTYNGAQYLEQALDSVCTQTFTDMEILIVDDCSSDDTLKIASVYAKADKRIRVVVNQSNLGLANNWNKCLKLARGDWIKYVFQDDILHLRCVEKLMGFAKESNIRLCYCKRTIRYEGSVGDRLNLFYRRNYAYIDTLFDGKEVISPMDYAANLLENLNLNPIGEPTCVLMHRSLFDRYGTFNTKLIQLCDLEFWNRVGLNEPIGFVRKDLATFRVHQNSTSFKNIRSNRGKLESIAYLHEMAFGAYYGWFREFSQLHGLDLIGRFKEMAREGWWRSFVVGGRKHRREWRRFVAEFPGISKHAGITWSYFIERIVGTLMSHWRSLLGRCP